MYQRPIISCNGSITEAIGKFVQFHLRDLSNKHEAFIQDSPDFLRSLEADLNEQDIMKKVSLNT